MGLLTPQAMEYLGLLGQSMLGGQSPNAGVNISQAMMFADQDMRKQAALKARLDEERQQAQMRDMQMQQMLKAQQAEEYMGKGIQQFMRPPQAATQEFRPGDMETPSQLTPASPGGFDQGGFAQYLAQNPATAQKALQFMPQQRGPEFKVVGNRLVKIEGGNASEAFSGGPDLPSGMRMGPSGPEWIPEYIKGKKDLATAGAPKVSVGGTVMEKEEHKQKAISNAKYADESANARRIAIRENSLIDAMLRNPLKTDAATPITATAAAWLSAAGMAPDRLKSEVGNFQAFRAAAKEMVLQKQLLQKGPQTESDARRLEDTVANPANEKNSNEIILRYGKALNNRAIAQAKFLDDWWKKNKSWEGAEAAWLDGEGGKSIWEDSSLSKFYGATDTSGPVNQDLQAAIDEAKRRGLVK